MRVTKAAFALAISVQLAGMCATAIAQTKLGEKKSSSTQTRTKTEPAEADSSRRNSPIRRVAVQQPIVESVQAPEVASGPTLDLAALKNIAYESSPSLREASANIDALVGKRTQAGLWSNPVFGFSGQQVASRGIADQNGVYVGQKIHTAQKLRTDQTVVSQEILRAQYFYDAQKLRLETDVTIAYYEALAAQRLLEQTTELTRIAEEGYKTAEALRRGSEASRIDVLQAKLEVDSTKILQDNAKHRLASAWKNLATIVGQRNLPPQTLVGKLEEGAAQYSWEDALTLLLEQSPELRVAQATAERARWAHQRALREVYPDIDANGLVQRDNQIRGWDGAIQVSIPVPIINRNQGQIRETLSNIAVAEQAVERTRLQLENRLAKVFERYVNALRQSERYEKDLLPTATEQLQLTTRVFKAGEVGYMNLLTAQRSYSQVNVNAIDAQRELAVSSARIEGLLLEGSLENPGLLP